MHIINYLIKVGMPVHDGPWFIINYNEITYTGVGCE